jgi:hypothetical protein
MLSATNRTNLGFGQTRSTAFCQETKKNLIVRMRDIIDNSPRRAGFFNITDVLIER